MKTLLVSLLLLPAMAKAQADGPNYRIPRGATSNAETCFTTELVSTPAGRGWTDWAPVVTEDRHQTTYWNDDTYFHALEMAEDGRSAEYSRFTEELIDRTYTHRRKEITRWTKTSRGWARADSVQDVSIRKAEGQPVRVTETGGGKTYIWDLRTYGEGDEQVSERTLLNPSALSTEGRKVGSHVEHCRFRLN